MSVLRFDPFRDFDRLLAEQVAGLRSAPRSVPMDAYRRGDQFLIHLDLPGVDPDAIELTVEQNVLTIKAERRFQLEEGDELVQETAERFTRWLLSARASIPTPRGRLRPGRARR
jgi:HSP20 family protein